MNILMGLVVATLGLEAAAVGATPTVECDWTGTAAGLLSCPKLQNVDPKNGFAVTMKGAPAGTTLAVGYWQGTAMPPSLPTTPCKATATGYTCSKPTLAATGIGLNAVAGSDTRVSVTPLMLPPSGPGPGPAPLTPPTPSPAPPAPPAATSHLHTLTAKATQALGANIPAGLKGKDWSSGYDYSNSGPGTAVIFLNTLGQPLQPLPEAIDETDDIWVVVVDYSTFVDGADITVSVSGCNRPPVDVRVYGALAQNQNDKLSFEELRARAQEPDIGLPIFQQIGKCAGADGGGPIVTVKSDTPNVTSTPVTIPVDPVYRFVVGLGLGGDSTKTKSLGVATVPGSTVATITETDDRIGLASLIFVGFYPFGRDFRKVDYFWQRLEAFVGLDPKALSQNVIIGGGINLVTGMDLLVGWRALTRHTELQPGSGLAVGSPFDGPQSSLPTTTVWGTGGIFVGIGVTNALLAKLH